NHVECQKAHSTKGIHSVDLDLQYKLTVKPINRLFLKLNNPENFLRDLTNLVKYDTLLRSSQNVIESVRCL
ncbi:MAG: hypothetical protein OXU23_18585, partial [Candidatus Poribacteria bacterium]|nr:hypothetical protein [Candidatus Poribacteria bacterium]